VAAVLLLDEYSPDFRLVALFAPGVPAKSHSPDQVSVYKGSNDEIIRACGAQALGEGG
jgi:hypothetical protein